MDLVTRTTHGRPVEAQARKADLPPTYPKGRICATPECSQRLSIYNEGPNCHACDLATGTPVLTKTQRQIIELARRGYSNAQIAEVIDSTPQAVMTRISELRAMGVELPFAVDREELRRMMEAR